jgi:WD40 repeat protein
VSCQTCGSSPWNRGLFGPFIGPGRHVSGRFGVSGGTGHSPDGRHIASGSWDGSLRIWDVPQDGEERIRIQCFGQRDGQGWIRQTTASCRRRVRPGAGSAGLPWTPRGGAGALSGRGIRASDRIWMSSRMARSNAVSRPFSRFLAAPMRPFSSVRCKSQGLPCPSAEPLATLV